MSKWYRLAVLAVAALGFVSCSSDEDLVNDPALKPGDVVTDFTKVTKYEESQQFQNDLDAFNTYAFAIRALRWDYWMLASDNLKNPEDFFTVAPENLGKNNPAALDKFFNMLTEMYDNLDTYEAAIQNLEDNGILTPTPETRGNISDGLSFGLACKSSATMGRMTVMSIMRSEGWTTNQHMMEELYNSLSDEQRRGYSDAISFWQDFSRGKLDNRSNQIFKTLYDMPIGLDAAQFREKCDEIGISPATNMAVAGQKLAQAGISLVIDACPINLGYGVDLYNTSDAQLEVMLNSLKFNKETGEYEGINTDAWKNWAQVWGHNVANYGRDFEKMFDKFQANFQSEFYTNWDEAKDWWIDNVFKDAYDFTANEVLFSDNLREATADHGKSLGLETKVVIRTVNDRPYEFVYLVDPATGRIRLGFVKDDYGNIVMFPGAEPTTRNVTVVDRLTGKRKTKTITIEPGKDTEVEIDLENDEEKLEENPENGELTLKPTLSYEDKTGEGGSKRFTIVTNYMYYTSKTKDDWISTTIPSDANFMYVKMTKNDTGKPRNGAVTLAATDSKGKVLKTVTLNITQQPYVDENGSVSASPSSLVFDSKGGKLTSNITYSRGAVFTGIDYDDELSGWLTIDTKDAYDGFFTLVADASANDTGKERSGTITIYAAYNQQALDNAMQGKVDPTLVLSTTILVKQSPTEETKLRTDPSAIYYNTSLHCQYDNGEVSLVLPASAEWNKDFDNCTYNITQNGKSFSANATLTLTEKSTKQYMYDYEIHKISFDVGQPKDGKYGPVNNLVVEYYGSNKSGDYMKWTLKATAIPCSTTYFNAEGTGRTTWEASAKNGDLQITSLEGERYAATAAIPTKRTFSLKSDKDDSITLRVLFSK